MFGVAITFVSSFLDEIVISLSKVKLNQGQISVYSLGLINTLAATVFFLLINIVKWEFHFSLASLPTLSVRAGLEIILIALSLNATALADRSTYGFVRVVTIPLLLVVDFLIGYKISGWQLIGIGIIMLSLFLLFSYQGVKKQGVWLSLVTAVMAVATISLYKYDITHFNSVAAEQTIILAILFIFLTGLAFFKAKENPFIFLKQKIYVCQTFVNAISALLSGYAYIFAPASVILSAYRSSSVFWSVISGKFYFHEKHFLIKIICLVLLAGGIVLLAV